MSEWLLEIVVGLALAILGFLYRQNNRKQLHDARQGTQQSVSNCGLLVQLIKDMQQHRGMSSACLSGDASFAARREEKKIQIESKFQALSDLAKKESTESCPCFTYNDWVLFRHQWRELIDTLSSMTVDQNIARHSQLISKLLEWLANIGESRIEPLAVEKSMVSTSRNFTHRLPQLTECLGQARAIGTGVASQHSCPPVARVRLLFLISRAESLLDQALTSESNFSARINAQHSIREMISTVRTRMLFSSGVIVTSNEFFALSSLAIDQVFAWINACEQESQLKLNMVQVTGEEFSAC